MSMEFSFWSFILLTLIIICVVRIIICSKQQDSSVKKKKKLPPGPWQLPIIGSLHHLFISSASTKASSSSSSLPHHIFRNLSMAYGSADGLLHLRLGEVSMVVASSPEAAKEVLKTHDALFATRPLFTAVKIMTYGGNTMSFAPYGDYWRQLRRICITELLSPKRVISFRSIREDEVHNLIHSIRLHAHAHPHAAVNLSDKLSSLTNAIMTRSAVGATSTSNDDQLEFIAAIKQALAISAGFHLTDLFPSCSRFLSFVSGFKVRLEKCHHNVDRILDRIIQQHTHKRIISKHRKEEEIEQGKVEEEEDFLDILLRLQESGNLQFELTNDRIMALIQDMLGAGSESSSVTLEWAMSELMLNPTVMRRAQSEVREGLLQRQHQMQRREGSSSSNNNINTENGGVMKKEMMIREDDIKELNYLKLIIKETLRLHPPGPLLLPRECQEKCEIMGYEIPKGTRVLVNIWSMGRDPCYWEDVETFKPERFAADDQLGINNPPNIDFKGTNFEYLPFGSGRRICPGITMGMANMELALANLLYHFNWELLPHDTPLDMAENFGVTASKRSPLCLRPIPYATCS